jgi:uncharacterized protein YdeI (YjbR/CyaY-like superfamily)
MIPTDRFEKIEIASRAELRGWLNLNHGRDASVWLVRFTKNVPDKHVDRLTLLDELICFGWIDGLARKLDETRTMQLISPREQQAWAQSYKDRAVRLEAEGLMMPPGRAAIARSRQLGLWDTYAAVDALDIPDDLKAALAGQPSADAFFLNAAPSYRRNVLRWIFQAKTQVTRDKRIATTVGASAAGRKIPQM